MFFHHILNRLEAKLPVGEASQLMRHRFNRDELEVLLRTKLVPSRSLPDHSENDPWPDCLLKVLDDAEQYGWLPDLLRGARQEKHKHRYFASEMDRLLKRIEASTEQPPDYFEHQPPVGKAHGLLLPRFDQIEFELLLRTKLDPPQNLADLSENARWPNCLLNVLDAAERGHWLEDLLKAAKAERPDRPEFQQALDELLTRTQESPGLEPEREAEPEAAPRPESPVDPRPKRVRINLSILLAGLLLLGLWGILVFGTRGFWTVLGSIFVLGGAGLTQSMLDWRIVHLMDRYFAWAIGLHGTTIGLIVLLVCGLGLSLFTGTVQASSTLGGPLSYRISEDSSQAEPLTAGQPELIWWNNPFSRSTLLIKAPGFVEEKVTLKPWWKTRIRKGQLTSQAYLVLVPSNRNIFFRSDHPVHLCISIVGQDQTYSVTNYIGEPVLLGPRDSDLPSIRAPILPADTTRILAASQQIPGDDKEYHSILIEGISEPLRTTNLPMNLSGGETILIDCQFVSPPPGDTIHCWRSKIVVEDIEWRTAETKPLTFVEISCEEMNRCP